ncbi:MAG TPA: hypothetical protein VIK54_14530 [Acidimicrobiia bacterium]
MRFTKTIASASVAAVLGLGGVSVAGAASTPSSSKPATVVPATKNPTVKKGVGTALRRRIRRQAGRLAAKTIGITPADLRQELLSGKTIAAIATEHGVNPQKVIDTVVTAANAKIAKAVSSHKITAERGAKLKTRIDNAIPKIVNDWHPKAAAKS